MQVIPTAILWAVRTKMSEEWEHDVLNTNRILCNIEIPKYNAKVVYYQGAITNLVLFTPCLSYDVTTMQWESL